MATVTVIHSAISTITKTASSAAATATSRAPAQGGILEGLNPTHYDSKNPITIFIIQVRSSAPVQLTSHDIII